MADNLFDSLLSPQEPPPPKPVKTNNLFDTLEFQEPKPIPTEAEDLQNNLEGLVNDKILRDEIEPEPDTNTDRMWAKLSTATEDAPTPTTYTEALGGAMQRHGEQYRPNPESMDDIVAMSNRLALDHMFRSGLSDRNGPKAGTTGMFKKLTGAYMYNLTVQYSDMTPKELPRVTERAVFDVAAIALDNAQSELTRIEQELEKANLGIIDFSGQGEEIKENDAPRIKELKARRELVNQDFAIARELQSRANEPKVQSWYLGTMHTAADQLAFTAPKDTRQADEAQIVKGLLDHPYQQAMLGGWPEFTLGKGEFAERMNGMFSRRLKLQGADGKAQAQAMQNVLAKSFQGTLAQERAEMMGLTPEEVQTATPTSMLATTHPRMVADMANILADQQGRQYLAEKSDAPDFDEQLEEWKQENGATVVDDLLEGGMSPLLELKATLDSSFRESVGDEFLEAMEKTLGSLGLYAMSYSDEINDEAGLIIPRAQEFYASVGATNIGKTQLGNFLIGSTVLGMGAATATAGERMKKAGEEGERDAELAIGPMSPLMQHPNQWLGDPSKLIQAVGTAGEMGITKEAHERIFNIRNNPLRQIGMAFTDSIAADTIETFAPLGVPASVIREQFKRKRNEAFNEVFDNSILMGVSEERFQKQVQHVAQVRRDNGGGASGMAASYLDTLALSVMTVGRDSRGMMQMMLEEPDDFAVLTGGTALTGFLGNQVMKRGVAPATRRLAQAMTVERARRVMERAIRVSPDAVHDVRQVTSLMQVRKQTGRGQRHASIEAATDALDYISGAREAVMEATPDFQNLNMLKWLDGQTRKASRTASEVLRHVAPEGFDEMLDTLGVDGITRNWIADGRAFNTLRTAAGKLLGFRSGRTRVTPRAAQQRMVFDEISNDPSLTMKELPFAPELMTPHVTNKLTRIFPEHKDRIMQAQGVQEAANWLQKNKQDVVARRSIGAENRANLEQFTVFARTVEANRLRKIAAYKQMARSGSDVFEPEAPLPVDPNSIPDVLPVDPARAARAEAARRRSRAIQQTAQLRRRSLERVSKLRAVRQELLRDGRPTDKTLARNSPLFDEYSPEQMIQFIAVRNGRDAVYNKLRKEFESETSFWGRVGQMGRRFDDPNEAGTAAANSMKREIVQEFFEQPGLQNHVRVDLLEGHITPKVMRRNINERRAIAKTANDHQKFDELRERFKDSPDDQKLIDELAQKYDDELLLRQTDPKALLMPGEWRTRRNLAEEWAEADRLAATERANRFETVKGVSGEAELGNQMNSAGRLVSGPDRLRTHVNDARAMGTQQRLLTRAYMQRVENLEKIRGRMSPNDRATLDAMATIARDEGINAPLAALRKRFPDYFRELAPETDDIAIQHLWDNSENFRKSFLKDMSDKGLISKESYNKWIGPYAPRKFDVDELPRIYGTDGIDLYQKTSDIAGVSLGELAAQRHISKTKAQIYPNGGRPITQHFDNVQDAEAWIEQNYGFNERGSFQSDIGGETGSTAQGSPYAILRPLGKEAQELGELPAGAGMYIQMRNTIEDMMQIDYFNAFDRKGISLTQKEFDIKFVEEGASATRAYEKMPENVRLGNLSGKYVHRNVTRQMEDYTEIRNIQNTILDVVESDANKRVMGVTSLVDSIPKGFKSMGDYMKAGIIHNGVARNPATLIGNFLSDTLLFARAAAGPEINTTLKGWSLGLESWNTIRKVKSGKAALGDLDVDVQAAYELGIVDEGGLFGAAGSLDVGKQAGIRAVLGDQTGMQVMLSPLKNPRLKKLMTREKEIDNILRDPATQENPKKFARFKAAKAAIQAKTRSEMGPVAKGLSGVQGIMDSVVGRNKGRLGDIESWSADVYGDLGNMNRLRAFLFLVKEKKFTHQAAKVQINRYMQTYSQIGNTAIGRGVKAFGKSPLGSPIVSFPYELARIGINMVRRQPHVLSAMMAAGLGRNMMAMALNGMDPYEGFEHLGITNNPLTIMGAFGQQISPLPDRQSLVWSNPAMAVGDVMQNFSATNGLAAAWDDPGDNTFLSDVMRVGVGLATNVAFTNPLFNAGQAMVSKRDSMTGKLKREGYQLLGDNLQRFIQPLMPSWTPIQGSTAKKLERARDGFKHAYTGREHSMLNKAIEFLGVKVKGNVAAFLDALPAGMKEPTKDAALSTVKAFAFMNLWEVPTDSEVWGEGGALNERDYFALVVAKSAYLDPSNGGDGAYAISDAETDLRRAFTMMASEDEVTHNRGLVLRDESKKRIEELMTARTEAGFFGADREPTKREVRNVTTRLLEMGGGYANAFDSFSVKRRTGIIAKMASSGNISDKLMDDLLMQYKLTRSGGLRGPANSDELAASAQVVQMAMRSPLTNERNKERLDEMIDLLEFWGGMADMREQIEDATTHKYIRNKAAMEQGIILPEGP